MHSPEWRDERDQPQARVLLDSISPEGVRLTTFEVTFHRFVLAEFNTHRVFSRNSASSRAIPFEKQVEKVMDSPAIPVEWRAEQRGMQGGDLLSDFDAHQSEEQWLAARNYAVGSARALHNHGVHKSIVNRILEPFLWHNVIVTATDWDGFWAQRCSELAQPEIRVAAEAMKVAFDAHEKWAEPLQIGEWHTPLIQPDEDDQFWDEQFHADNWREFRLICEKVGVGPSPVTLRKAVSAARCARVSYLTHDGKRSLDADITLFNRLVSADPGHWSPFEHVATPCDVWIGEDGYAPGHDHLGNLRGWGQFRHQISEGANA